jgi:hypothetical protein
MQDVIELSGHVNETGNILVIKLEMFVWEQVFYVFQITGNEVVHAYDMKSLFNESVAQVRAQEAGGSGYEYAFH